MKLDAIILAGGLGTRLREVVPDVPKPLAPIHGKPFLDILLNRLEHEVANIILAISYKAENFVERYGNRVLFSIEKEPLGTGGGLKQALHLAKSDDVLVLNGDTFVDFSLKNFYQFHHEKKANLSILCLPSPQESRYGTIELNERGEILQFKEKQKGIFVSGGVYLIKRDLFQDFPDRSFSLEHQFFPFLLKKRLFGYTCDKFFIDIGTKESYAQAERSECLKF